MLKEILDQFLLVPRPLLPSGVFRQPFQVFFYIAKIGVGKALEISGQILNRLIGRGWINDLLGRAFEEYQGVKDGQEQRMDPGTLRNHRHHGRSFRHFLAIGLAIGLFGHISPRPQRE